MTIEISVDELDVGTNVQILSGLAQGETVYYRYADSLEYTFAPRK